jgi:Holliday junction resolvase
VATPEGKVKDKVKAILQERGALLYYFMPAMGSFGKAGVPDVIGCMGGQFIGIEVKADAKKNPPTPLQLKNLAEIRAAGGHALVIDAHNFDELVTLLNNIEATT